jgi:N-acetylneuraminate synthase
VLGACTLERHISIDRALYGSDQSASVQIDALRAFVRTVRAVKQMLGNGVKEISEAEQEVRDKLRVDVDA